MIGGFLWFLLWLTTPLSSPAQPMLHLLAPPITKISDKGNLSLGFK
jgi:hypothetical protein